MITPLPDAPPQGMVPPAQRPSTWFERNWKWFVTVLVVGVVSCVVVFVCVLILMVGGLIRSSYPYQFALRQANASDVVAERIGCPFRTGWLTTGNINMSGSSGEANLTIRISGAKGKGRIFVAATKREGLWSFQTLDLVVDGETNPISLLGAVPSASPSKSPADGVPISLHLHPIH